MSEKDYTTFRPWFGDWPPEIRNEDSTMKEKTFWNDHRPTITLFLVFLLGVGILLTSYLMEVKGIGDSQLTHDIAIAFMVSGIIGISVDQILRRQMAQDAFKASIGYLLPPELKPELEWIYKQDIIAKKHIETVTITPISEDLVDVVVEITRTYENISHHKVLYRPIIWIDEWFHEKHRSKILEFGWTGKSGDRRDDYDIKHRECHLHAEAKEGHEIWLKYRDTIDVWYKYKETKHIRDIYTDTFLLTTRDPFIEVRVPDGYKADVTFATHKEEKKKPQGTNKYKLEGTLLPGQEINVSWWKPEDSQIWLDEKD